MTGRIFSITTYHKPGEKATEAAEQWKKLGICAIGWSEVNFCGSQRKEEIKQLLKKENYDTRGAEDIWLFIREINENDLVLAYSRDNTIAYVGEVKGPCKHETENFVGNPKGLYYAHQRRVEWWNGPYYFDRRDLPEYLAGQFGKRGITIAEIHPGSKGFRGFIRIVKACASSGSKFPGINEDAIKAGLIKYLHHSLDRLEEGFVIRSAEVAIGKKKRPRPDFIAEDKQGRTVLVECKGTAGESAVEQILRYEKEYGKDKGVRLIIVAFRISEACMLAAKKAGNIELIECDLNFRKIQ
jgi:hypothetical protein